MIDWWEYERRKRQLPNNLTSQEYEAAVRKIEADLYAKKSKKNNERRN